MSKVNWRAFMVVVYKEPRMEYECEAMVVSINFDGELLLLRPIGESPYIQEDFWANLKYVELPKPKLRVLKNTKLESRSAD